MISADLLREARLRAGLTQAELGRRSGKPASVISRWERGQVEPSLETLRSLIRACGLELTFRLANYDDSYVEYIERYLALTPAERVAHAAAREREYAKIRAAALAELRALALLEVLVRHEVRFVVVGAIAAIAQGYPLTTQGLDVTPARDRENLERIAGALRELGASCASGRPARASPFRSSRPSWPKPSPGPCRRGSATST